MECAMLRCSGVSLPLMKSQLQTCSRELFIRRSVSRQFFRLAPPTHPHQGVPQRSYLRARADGRESSTATSEAAGSSRMSNDLKPKSTTSMGCNKIYDLKLALDASLAQSNTSLTEESIALIEQIEALNPTPRPVTREDLWRGSFQLVTSATKEGLPGAVITLGRATFNTFNPKSLWIQMGLVYNDVGGRIENAYDTIIPFTVVQEGLPPLEGLLVNEAEVSRSSETRLDVLFLASTLRRRDSSVDLDAWREVFGGVNEMDADGVCKVTLPPAKGWLEFTYLDEEYRITRGNLGSVVVVKRTDLPNFIIGA